MRLPALKRTAAFCIAALLPLLPIPVSGEETTLPTTDGGGFFPPDNFVQINPTLPNARLDFNDDSRESCCAKDYLPAGKAVTGVNVDGQATGLRTSTPAPVVRSEFEKANPGYLELDAPTLPVSCERFTDMPELASQAGPSADIHTRENGTARTLPIVSYSTNVSLRRGAEYATDPAMHMTGSFHVETMGGDALLTFRDVNRYSVCMARGNNVAVVANTDNGSILAYNGSDQIYLSGDNTNMLTRTGAGEDIIEVYQAVLNEQGETPKSWKAYNIFKTALSGGLDTDTLVIKGTPPGTKWCHIGSYRMAGEVFHVVEFALPPSVTQGPRRQRVSIGESVEFVVIKGKKYQLADFLAHGAPMDTVARAIPLGAPLPKQ